MSTPSKNHDAPITKALYAGMPWCLGIPLGYFWYSSNAADNDLGLIVIFGCILTAIIKGLNAHKQAIKEIKSDLKREVFKKKQEEKKAIQLANDKIKEKHLEDQLLIWKMLKQQKELQTFEPSELNNHSYAELMHLIGLHEANHSLFSSGLFALADANMAAMKDFEDFRSVMFPHHWTEEKIAPLFFKWFYEDDNSLEEYILKILSECTKQVARNYQNDGVVNAHDYRGGKEAGFGDKVYRTVKSNISNMDKKVVFLCFVHDVLELCFLGIASRMERQKYNLLTAYAEFNIVHPPRPSGNAMAWFTEHKTLKEVALDVEQRLGKSHLSSSYEVYLEFIKLVPLAEDIFSSAFDVNSLKSNPEIGGTLSSIEGLVIGQANTGTIKFSSEKSLITIASPGSGKTQCHVLPNLNAFKGAAIVLDIKGECALNSAKWRKDNVGPVILFAPANEQGTKRYNPLSFISQDPKHVWEEARLLAELLIVPKSQSDPTWENQARQLLTLLISYVIYLPEDRRNMSSVLDLLNDMGLDDALANTLVEGAPFPSAMRRTANNFKRMKETAEKQFSGVVSGALQHLGIWEGPLVEKLTSTSDWSPMDFRSSTPPTLYLIIPPNQIETYAPLVRVIIAQHVRMLMQKEPDREAPPVLFMLDELPRLGKMEPIREALEVGRSYRLQLWMFAQFAGQLYDAYGKEIAEGMIESCGVRMYMNAGQETAEKLSKALGTKENMLTGKTEPVVTPQALTGPEWKDDILVFATGEKPLRLKKSFFHEQQQQD